MAFVKAVLNVKPSLNIALLGIGTFLLLTSSVEATELTSSAGVNQLLDSAGEITHFEPAVSEISPSVKPILVAQDRAICGLEGRIFRRFETTYYRVFICEDQNSDSLTYVGMEKGAEQSSNIILPLVSSENDTYVAVNGEVTYTIDSQELIITENSRIIGREKVLSSGI
ncbi:hypothetical protein [Microcoleus sp. FACHB-672]|uniref:hypothetical protein n=1 Tax=Microcoleus sp. FACHB-672 TaxID=2692825 RepID=UPI0016846721|nr:hypothetical protein [Microcoleus sp. FACHB-672]MBD2040396.1 hypothetical protein [Microcoleus sp. FACHB-672]